MNGKSGLEGLDLGNLESAAQVILQAAEEVLGKMEPVLGAHSWEIENITNTLDQLGALPDALGERRNSVYDRGLEVHCFIKKSSNSLSCFSGVG